MAYNQENNKCCTYKFQQKNYVERCIKSLLNQTYKNFEIIAIDNKSTDKSYKPQNTKTKLRLLKFNEK